jgi:hypothetical protein
MGGAAVFADGPIFSIRRQRPYVSTPVITSAA